LKNIFRPAGTKLREAGTGIKNAFRPFVDRAMQNEPLRKTVEDFKQIGVFIRDFGQR
jgi:hypothetical protein